MKKILPAIVVAAIVLAFAGALLARVLMHGDSFAPGETIETFAMNDQPLAATDDPTIFYSVSGVEGVYAYHIPTRMQDGPSDAFNGIGLRPYANGSNQLCGRDFSVSMSVTCLLDENNVLTFRIGGEDSQSPVLVSATIDPRSYGFTTPAVDGYLWPVAISDDHTVVYLDRRVETESYVAGLWRLDVPSGVITEITDVRKHNLYQYEINTRQKTLVGVTFIPPENLGAEPTGPSSAYLVDLDTNKSRLLAGAAAASTNSIVENPMVSDNGTEYAVHLYGSPVSTVTSIKGPPVATVNGVVRDWIGDTMVVDRDGNLFLYDLATKAETQLTHETDATVEYLGVVR